MRHRSPGTLRGKNRRRRARRRPLKSRLLDHARGRGPGQGRARRRGGGCGRCARRRRGRRRSRRRGHRVSGAERTLSPHRGRAGVAAPESAARGGRARAVAVGSCCQGPDHRGRVRGRVGRGAGRDRGGKRGGRGSAAGVAARRRQPDAPRSPHRLAHRRRRRNGPRAAAHGAVAEPGARGAAEVCRAPAVRRGEGCEAVASPPRHPRVFRRPLNRRSWRARELAPPRAAPRPPRILFSLSCRPERRARALFRRLRPHAAAHPPSPVHRVPVDTRNENHSLVSLSHPRLPPPRRRLRPPPRLPPPPPRPRREPAPPPPPPPTSALAAAHAVRPVDATPAASV